MKGLLASLVLLMPVLTLAAESPQTLADSESACIECHEKTFVEYQRSQMAKAANTNSFLQEWKLKGKTEHCLDCHAPTGGQGISCIDCHGKGGHPFASLDVPESCAKCHDAPGEVTVQSYIHSPSARRGENCLHCHFNKNKGHEFIGPSTAGFLDNVATIRVSLRRDSQHDTAIFRITHNAGHALPGGTTGRSVWLVVEEMNSDYVLNKTEFRFGWFYDTEQGWLDKTISPGSGKIIEVPMQSDEKASKIRARLIYRFIPGYLDKYDPKQVILDQLEYEIPRVVKGEQ